MDIELTLAHSPDSDDAFMFFGLISGQVKTYGLAFKHVVRDIHSLNQDATHRLYDVSAISLHQYPFIYTDYQLLSTGACFGVNYGPTVVAPQKALSKELKGSTVGIPGARTTAALLLKLYEPTTVEKEMEFTQIIPAVLKGDVPLGLVIHEGQMTLTEQGLDKVVDLGEWWYRTHNSAPLPLGALVIRRPLSEDLKKKVRDVLRESIQYGLAHVDEALPYVRRFARGLSDEQIKAFVQRYVNDLTLSFSPSALEALERLYQEAFDRKLIPCLPPLDLV